MDGFDRRLPIDLVQSEEGSEENKEAKCALSDEAGSETSLASIALHREAQLRRQRAAEAFAKAEAEAKAKAENERKAKARSLVKTRIKAGRNGNQTPLAILAGKEAVLHEHSAALTEFSDCERMPDKNLLSGQLMGIAVGLTGKNHMQKKTEVAALYAALRSRDPIESMLDRSMVAANVTTMDCFARAAMTSNLRARELNLRYGMKGVQVQLDVVKV